MRCLKWALALLMLLPANGWAAVTVIGTPTEYKANNTSFSFSHTVTSGTDCLVVGVATWGGAVTAISAGGAAMTQITSAATAYSSSGNVSLWIKTSPSAGATTISFTTGASELGAGAINFAGCDTGTPSGGGTSATGTSTTPSVTVSGGSPGANDLVVDAAGWDSADVSAVGADQTNQIDTSSADFRTNVAMSTQAGNISPAAMSWTLGGSVAWGSVAAVIKSASGGGGPDTTPFYRRRVR